MLLSPGERRMVKVSPILSIAKQNTVSGHSASVPVPANTLPMRCGMLLRYRAVP